MQFCSIGRQVFTKFLRKNTLLFSSPQGGQSKSSNYSNGNSTKLLDSQQHQQLQFQVPQEDAESSSFDRRLNLSLALSKHVSSLCHPPALDRRMLTSVAFLGEPCGTIHTGLLPESRKSIFMMQSAPFARSSSCNQNISINSSRSVHTVVLSNLDEQGTVFEAVSLAEMKRFFRKHEIPFEDGYTCLRVDCFFCKKSHRKKKYFPWDSDKLYVNKTTGYFVCINCKITGTWKNLQDLIMLAKSGQGWTKADLDVLKKDDPLLKYEDKLNDLETNSREISTLTTEEWVEIAGRFGLDKLKKIVLEQYEMRHNPEEDILLLPIHSVELKRVGYQIFKLSPKSGELIASTVPKNCNEIFGWKPVLQTFASSTLSSKIKPIILVQSALDVLAVSSGSSHLPLGLHPECHHLPQEFLPKLEHFNDIILWFGSDVKSWEAAKAFGRKLEERRCKLIRPIDLHPAPFIALQQDQNITKIISSAQPMEHKAITTFSKLREEVLSELNHQDQVAGVKWTRYPYMTKLLKGHRRGELTILTGGTGSGKTTFMSEYSLDLCIHGVNTLWGSFEIRNVRLAKTMLTQFAEMDLEKHIDQYDSWADKFEKLPLYFMTFHGQQSVKAVLDAMTHAAYVYDIGHVVVDNLQFMLGVSEGQGGNMDRFWRQDLIVAAFRKFATVNNCHVTLVMHPRKEGNDVELSNSSIFGGAKASQEADNILILQDRRLTSPRGKKYLQVTKNRFSGDLGMFVLEFNRDCLSFVTKKKSRPDQSVIVKPKNDESNNVSNSNTSTNTDSFLSDRNE